MRPLTGVVVLDLSKVFAGPLCGQYLGDLGAEVIKVEPVTGGDDTRAWSPQRLGQSATFLAVNHNKRSLAVDLKSEEGREIVHHLAARCDVVIQGFGSGAAGRLGVDYPTLKALNPKLVYCEISGFGRSGPLAERPGYDVMLQAFSGMLASMGEPEGGFARASFSPVDLGTGMHATSGILAALLNRAKTGEGAYLEISLLDTALAFMTYHAQIYWQSGQAPRRMGTGHPSLAPYQAFAASDGALMIGVGNDGQWRRLCEVLGLDELASDPAFATNEHRVRNFEETVRHVAERIRHTTAAHWLEVLTGAGLPCAPIQPLDVALAHPQVAATGLVTRSDHPVLGPLQHIGFPVCLDGARCAPSRPPPLHGEHSDEILAELGFDAPARADLERRGVIGTGPGTKETDPQGAAR